MLLSALILTKNEEEIIEDCLKQLDFVDEIVVVDQKSSDKTQKIVKKYTNNIFESQDEDFDKNRNLLSKMAKGKWLFYLDSDERLTNELKLEIKKSIEDDKFSAFYIPRKNYILGRAVNHGGWWPDYAPRLFKKDDFLGWSGKIHESPQFVGKAGYFKNPLIHITARNLNLMLKKTIQWAKIEADLYYRTNNPKVSVIKVFKASALEFTYRYIVKRGFLDGVVGLMEAIFQALHKVIVFVYLWELQNETKRKFEHEKQITATSN